MNEEMQWHRKKVRETYKRRERNRERQNKRKRELFDLVLQANPAN